MADVVVFGLGQVAETVHEYLTYDSDHKVVAFTVDEEFRTETSFKEVPVVPYEDLLEDYPPGQVSLYIAMSYRGINEHRKKKYLDSKAKGYGFITYVSSRACVMPSARIGENTFIMEQNVIQPYVSVGNNCLLWSGNHIGHHTTIADHCFIASHAVISGAVKIGESCFVGVNATLRDNISVGEKSVIGAGALVLRDAPPESVFRGVETLPRETTSRHLKSI